MYANTLPTTEPELATRTPEWVDPPTATYLTLLKPTVRSVKRSNRHRTMGQRRYLDLLGVTKPERLDALPRRNRAALVIQRDLHLLMSRFQWLNKLEIVATTSVMAASAGVAS